MQPPARRRCLNTLKLQTKRLDDHAICAEVGIEARHANPQPSAPEVGFSERTDIRLYPNPTNGTTRLLVPHAYYGATMRLTNMMGQVLQEAIVNATINTIDLQQQPEGVYFITITQEGKSIYQNKIVKVE